jgi:hypothetical protein
VLQEHALLVLLILIVLQVSIAMLQVFALLVLAQLLLTVLTQHFQYAMQANASNVWLLLTAQVTPHIALQIRISVKPQLTYV